MVGFLPSKEISPAMASNRIQDEISKKLKQFRTERKLTLEKLALRTDCTKSYISQLEKGLTAPSVSMLGRLAGALDIHVADFFRDIDNQEGEDWCLRKSKRRHIAYPDGKVVTQLLTRAMSQKKIQPITSIIKPGGTADQSGQLTHPAGSEEFVLVMKGELHFEINGNEMSLEEGDTLYFNGELPHRWENKGNKDAEVLFVFTPPIW
jgi:transcriptional regulator with XRE-family HTH domain